MHIHDIILKIFQLTQAKKCRGQPMAHPTAVPVETLTTRPPKKIESRNQPRQNLLLQNIFENVPGAQAPSFYFRAPTGGTERNGKFRKFRKLKNPKTQEIQKIQKNQKNQKIYKFKNPENPENLENSENQKNQKRQKVQTFRKFRTLRKLRKFRFLL